ncbi:hypothetical protein K7G19_19700 [Cupriavidus sp. DB3]|uniref:hypothetical protein n=1 Tax=Cupriavidus sp. DB3 TaxID=2873259 RepID=UPI001CF283B9|nr:hypothetical protein [Cupriavidus sp. DB3]MCA7085817.1 hypothetical protein [Cupriavidus sp. DB3]
MVEKRTPQYDASRLRVLADWMEQDGINDAAETLRRIARHIQCLDAPAGPDQEAQRERRDAVIAAAVNLVKVKGRYHSQKAYERLAEAVGAMATGNGGKP